MNKKIFSIFLILIFLLTITSCKTTDVKIEETVPATETNEPEKISETPLETTSETTEETKTITETEVIDTDPVEDEGVMVPYIEGLKYNKDTNTYYALEVNPYGLEINTKAGVIIKEAVEIDGAMESSIGLKPEVIKIIQKKIMEENKEFKYPLPFNFDEAKGIKINEVGFPFLDDEYKSMGAFWENNKRLEAANIPAGTKIYSPLDPSHFTIWRDNPSSPLEYAFYYYVFTSELNEEELLFKNERFDLVSLTIMGIKLNLIPPGIEENKGGGHNFLAETKMGEPIAERKEKLLVANESITIIPSIYQLKDKNVKIENGGFAVSNISKGLETGLAGLLKIEEIPVFISLMDE